MYRKNNFPINIVTENENILPRFCYSTKINIYFNKIMEKNINISVNEKILIIMKKKQLKEWIIIRQVARLENTVTKGTLKMLGDGKFLLLPTTR